MMNLINKLKHTNEHTFYTSGKVNQILDASRPCDQADIEYIQRLADDGFSIAKSISRALSESGKADTLYHVNEAKNGR